ncbi:MAG: hypothetical protein MIO87_00095 [Methanomassiliicoccales archaeon]|nr:hypothetical protein [Methanomassiliicoccales archaeon]TFG57506.1 MAG: hypothetical protein E4H30_00270 [Methanomassiliicoccus sp.]
MTVVNIEDVVNALSNTMGKKGMSHEDLEKLAEYILSFFGYTDEVIDNRLTSEDRDVFYMLEEEGFLTTTQEEVHLKKGKLWRIHYWILKKDQIKRMANKVEGAPLDPNDPKTLYEGIAEDVWKTRER